MTEILFPEAEEWIENQINLKGPLAGIPVSLKDSIHVAGFDTSVGYSCNVGKPQLVDGPIVKMLKDAGKLFWLHIRETQDTDRSLRRRSIREDESAYHTPILRKHK